MSNLRGETSAVIGRRYTIPPSYQTHLDTTIPGEPFFVVEERKIDEHAHNSAYEIDDESKVRQRYMTYHAGDMGGTGRSILTGSFLVFCANVGTNILLAVVLER